MINKKILFTLLIGIMLINLAVASTVSRSFSKTTLAPGEIVNITLSVSITGGETYYAIDEQYSPGFSLINNGGGDITQSGHLKWIIITGASSTYYTYSVQAPLTPGVYVFSGLYGFEGGLETNISGATQVIVSSTSTLKINEFANDPDSGNDWIEIYNPESSSFNLALCNIKDGADNTLILTGTLNPNSYSVFEFDARLNMYGDIIKLNCSNQIVDQVTYGDWNDGNTSDNAPANHGADSTGRYPNGLDTNEDANDFIVFSTYTRGSINMIIGDITSPIIINLVDSPGTNNALITWNTNENSNSSISYGDSPSLGTNLGENSFVTSHAILINGLESNTLYYYKVLSCDASSNCNESGIRNFTTLQTSISNQTDDLMMNYVRGKILIEDIASVSGTNYELEVVSGPNRGYIYSSNIDNNIPIQLQGNGYFDTGDNVNFNTGDEFIIRIIGIGYDCYGNGIFSNGGNGNFENESNLFILNCMPGNSAPILQTIGNETVDENNLLEFNINASDIDGDILYYGVQNLPFGANFEDKTFSWTPNFDQAGDYFIVFTVNDSNASDSETVYIRVSNVNRAPVINMGGSYSITEGITTTIETNASDPDGDSLSYFILSENISKVNCEITGNFLVLIPVAGWNGATICELGVSDGNLTEAKNITINVLPVNSPPILIINIPNIEWDEGIVLDNYLNLSRYFIDPDSSLTYSVVGNSHVNISFDGNLASFNAKGGWYGSESVVFTANDGEYSTDSNSVTLRVIHVGAAPNFLPLSCETSLLEDVNYDCALEVNNPENISFTLEVSSELNVNCEINDGRLYYQSDQDYYGLASCTLKVSNIYGEDSEQVNVNVHPVNDAPILQTIGNKIVHENETIIIQLNATDVDNDILTYYSSANFGAFNQNTGRFEFTPDFGDEGIYSVSFSVRDSVLNDEENITITILHQNRNPILDQIRNKTLDEDSELSFNVYATDPDGDSISFSINQEDLSMVDCSIDSLGLVILNPANNFYGWASCSVKVRDVYGGEDIKQFYIYVDGLPDMPQITGFIPAENPRLLNGSSQLFSIGASDPDGDSLTVFWYLDNLLQTLTSGWNYLFYATQPGSHNLTAIVSDSMFNVSHEWTVFVGDVEEFTCSEVGGDICRANEECLRGTLNTSDSSSLTCCSVQCTIRPPEFDDANDRCEIADLSNLIVVEITEPEEGDDFEINDEIEVNAKVKNDLDYDGDFEVHAYLYDLENDEVVEDLEEEVDIDEGDYEKVDFTFNLSSVDVENNNYAIMVSAIESEDSCNQAYINIELKRPKHYLEIKKAELDGLDYTCGDSGSLEVRLKNLGKDDEEVYITIENKELGISEKTENFEIEEYDKNDEETKILSFLIPGDIIEKTYFLDLIVYYGDEKILRSIDFAVRNCLTQQEVGQKIDEKEIVKNQGLRLKSLTQEEFLLLILVLIIACIILIGLAIVVVLRRYYN